MDISTLSAFLAVARFQSFSKASNALHLSQSAVSKRVAALESELDTQLFNRVSKQISLTEAGKQLLPKADELVQQAEELHRYASTLNDDISGTLSIAIAHHIGLHRLPPILRSYNQKYPQVSLDLRFKDSDQAFYAVEQGDIEYALITLPSQIPEKMYKEVIWQDELKVMVSKEHELARCKSVGIHDLEPFPAVLSSSNTETYKIIRRHFDKANMNLRVQMQTNNLETLKMLTTAGVGWSLLPVTMLNAQLQVLNFTSPLSRELGLVGHRRRSLSNAALAFKELLKHDLIV